ncbi:hypothetical protein RchiOBHm_Chr2g0154721 [Rosa chinensis]|uniref:Uncharacterized protein n=1 Tax=Rosa chinensis TaxID=74649 RepID=A0A2P6S118_ROSCH|nr:hypothetical protein RchiOBHm_Chr2g0154721 [Rosa chinensis]
MHRTNLYWYAKNYITIAHKIQCTDFISQFGTVGPVTDLINSSSSSSVFSF